MGWLRAPVEALEQRPLQCHRCLRREHVIATCTYTALEEDRRSRCYRCGKKGHGVATCDAAPHCPLCTDLGRPAAHRLGGKACAPIPRGGAKRTQKVAKRDGAKFSAPKEGANAGAITPAPASLGEKATQPSLSGAREEKMEVEQPPTPQKH
ncbi:uncharacterized protein LOC109861611 [Pseudomyrmex gracilis]|uniref:uncharacterized protein LOC109861611 n=1 Tax=Pseudomyrmex gracilis TaxID=219809 RepID=UPI000994D2ED|nr:uncharacterized protein LOC109861611 [Pseudomyrmex gracilis]